MHIYIYTYIQKTNNYYNHKTKVDKTPTNNTTNN